MDNFLATCRCGSSVCKLCKLSFETNFFVPILQIAVKDFFLGGSIGQGDLGDAGVPSGPGVPGSQGGQGGQLAKELL